MRVFAVQSPTASTWAGNSSTVVSRLIPAPVHSSAAEQEAQADRVSMQVMRMPGSSRVSASADRESLRRASLRQQRSAPGKRRTRLLEPRLGHDFSRVRVHTDGESADRARALRARAYTVGQDIVFGNGQFEPHTIAGRQLLAHELAHVVQQGAGSERVQCKLQVGAGLAMDTKGFTTTKTGDVYTCPKVVKGSLWNELFTSLLASPRVFKLVGATAAQVNATSRGTWSLGPASSTSPPRRGTPSLPARHSR